MESSTESVPRTKTIAERIQTRVDAMLAHDPLSQKIITQWEAVARARMKLPDTARAIGKTAAIAANAADIAIAVAFGGWGIVDFIGAKRMAANTVATAKRQKHICWGAAKLGVAPILLGIRPIARGTVLIGSSQ